MLEITLPAVNGRLPSIAVIELAAKENGIKFGFDGKTGTFSRMGVEGTFTLEADRIHVIISKKPFLIPESTVRSSITEWFNSVMGKA